MASNDLLAWATLLATALGTMFMGIQALKGVTLKKEVVVCPNCGQPFDTSKFPVVLGKKRVTCPRCWYTWE